MTFFPDQSTCRSGKLYSKISDPKVSASVQNPAITPATRDPKIAEEPINGVSKDLIEERIKANLDPLNAHLSTSTPLLNQLIQESSARDSPTADTCTQQTQSRHSPSHEAGSSKALPASTTGNTGFPADTKTLFPSPINNFFISKY